jgi:hypothetical protein
MSLGQPAETRAAAPKPDDTPRAAALPRYTGYDDQIARVGTSNGTALLARWIGVSPLGPLGILIGIAALHDIKANGRGETGHVNAAIGIIGGILWSLVYLGNLLHW